MNSITRANFELARCQATAYTPDYELSARGFLRELYADWADLFDDEPQTIPPLPALPREVPRVTLQSRSREWKCEIASGRINLHWQQREETTDRIGLETFFSRATTLLLRYRGFINDRIGRLSAVVTRFAEQERPGLFLARHFCQERWDTAPLNRPESFELSAHKVFHMGNSFKVNSWARNKTGRITVKGVSKPLVVFEQDINSLDSESKTREFTVDEIKNFYELATTELDFILGLYYPEAGGSE